MVVLPYHRMVSHEEVEPYEVKPQAVDYLLGGLAGVPLGATIGLLLKEKSPALGLGAGLLTGGLTTYLIGRYLAADSAFMDAARKTWQKLPEKEKKRRLITAIIDVMNDIRELQYSTVGTVGGSLATTLAGKKEYIQKQKAKNIGSLLGKTTARLTSGDLTKITALRQKLNKMSYQDLVHLYAQLERQRARMAAAETGAFLAM